MPEEAEGEDLSHLALGEKGPEPEAAFLQGLGHTYLWKDGHEWRALRDKKYTYAIYVDVSELLFDNLKDPHQMKNLINDRKYRKVADRLREIMDNKMNELEDTFEKCI